MELAHLLGPDILGGGTGAPRKALRERGRQLQTPARATLSRSSTGWGGGAQAHRPESRGLRANSQTSRRKDYGTTARGSVVQ